MKNILKKPNTEKKNGKGPFRDKIAYLFFC